MAVVRWRFTDPVTSYIWTVPINPNQMSSPYPSKQRQTLPATPNTAYTDGSGILTLQAPVTPFEWTFGGAIRTEEHHDELRAWSQVPNPILIRDHFSRTWKVVITQFDATDRRPTMRTPWRMTYTMRSLMFGRVS
jgi:hypothetical protein